MGGKGVLVIRTIECAGGERGWNMLGMLVLGPSAAAGDGGGGWRAVV
jgi:hypothetical protein